MDALDFFLSFGKFLKMMVQSVLIHFAVKTDISINHYFGNTRPCTSFTAPRFITEATGSGNRTSPRNAVITSNMALLKLE